MRAISPPAIILFALVAAPGYADLRVTYVDRSPDLITIENRSGCDLGSFELTIDLGQSPAGLIFDTTGRGAGLAGYAPLQIVDGGAQVLGLSAVSDGDSMLRLEMDFLRSHGSVTLAVDVDDTSAGSELGQTIIAGSEIAGAVADARFTSGGASHRGVFGPDGVAIVPLEACIS